MIRAFAGRTQVTEISMPQGQLEHVNITVTDPERSAKLFENLCGWHERWRGPSQLRSEEHTSELQSLMRISYAVFCLKKKNNKKPDTLHDTRRATNYQNSHKNDE